MKESIRLTQVFPTDAATLYRAWLDSDLHSKMTGGEATCSNKVGGSFTAWGDYISGTNTSLTKNKEIVQRWRTAEFKETDLDSVLTIKLKDLAKGCELTLIHTNIPEGQTQYKEGWEQHYFAPMLEWFGK
jgi:activator of HSP90 ATPase